MGSLEEERTTVGWAARDPSGILSPYTYNLRNNGPDDVYIKVHYCGICHSDLHQIKNDLGMSNYPMVPGHEVVGEVLEVGSNVGRFRVGEIVGVGLLVGCCKNCRPCKTDIEQYCSKKIWSYNDVYIDGKPTQGGFAETMVVEQKFVVKIPEGLAAEQAAPLLCAGVTVYSPLAHFGEEAVAMVEEPHSGDEATNSHDSDWSMDRTAGAVVRVKTLHISSPILAAKSPFFYKLFSNGMRESEQRHVSLRINASEEAALMELLNFMYSNTLTTTTAPALLDVLMAADKFEVASCMRFCSRLLRNMPMTPDSALLYLELPSSVLMADAVQPLTDAAKQYLAGRYKDITKFQEEVMGLPLAGVEAILSSDDLQVASEDAVYDFVLRWSRQQYPKLEERREVLGAHLARLIRFPYMTCRKLKKVLTCSDFDHDVASKLVLEGLFFKAEAPHRQRALAAEDSASSNRRFVERAYKYRPVKVVEFELPRQQCVVYLDLKREECANLFPSGRVYSQAFHLGGQGFFLSAHCNMDQQSSFHCFGLFLGMQEKGSVSFAVDYEFAARSRPTEEFVSKYKGNYMFTGGKAVGYRNLFAIPWTSFMAEDSLYFINGVLHLRAELTIRH